MDTNRYKVMLIDDDFSAIELARSAAAEIFPEIELVVVGGGDAVLDWLKGSAGKDDLMPDIILMDLKFPKLEGLAVLRKLRLNAGTSDIPVVSYSAEYTQDDVLTSYQVGANSFVPKPMDIEQFREFFRERLGYWMQIYQSEAAQAAAEDAAE